MLQVQAAALRLWKPIAGERDDYIANPKVCICAAFACVNQHRNQQPAVPDFT